jgi:hypothetical protein
MPILKFIAALPLLALTVAPLDAKVVRIEAGAPRPLRAAEGRPAYETVSGTFYGELDPADPTNAIITDLDRATRNAAGKIEYSATFTVTRPVQAARRSGVLFYSAPNRGFLFPFEPDADGHVYVASGWQGDIAPSTGFQTASVPVARGITGPVSTLLTGMPAGPGSTAIFTGFARPTPMPAPVTLDNSRARLVILRTGQRDRTLAARDWAFADCRTTPFPGAPDPAQLCLRAGFEAGAAYQLSYEGRDPQVLGIGFAATRDLVAFLRKGQAAGGGLINPAGAGIRWAVAQGHSQSGNYLRSFVNLGFNRSEDGTQVFDGINADIAARQVPLNLRFGVPGGAAGRFEAGSEGVLWWGSYDDRTRRRGTGSLLDRCTATQTCPKVVETFGSAEMWNLRASPGLVGTDARADIALPGNVRRYYFPGVTHGGSRGTGFMTGGDPVPPQCQLPGNPNPMDSQLRAATRALVAWVKDGREPPPSRYPTLAAGDLVQPAARAMGWPAIPGAPLPDGRINPFYDNDFGAHFNYRDVSGVADRQPPTSRRLITQLVPRVNADGNETAGLPSVQLLVPLGTYTGWNVQATGYGTGGGCSLNGGFIPFARTLSERQARGDPRPSLEERYGNHAGFVGKVLEAIAQQQAAGWLLPDDAARIYEAAQASDVLK